MTIDLAPEARARRVVVSGGFDDVRSPDVRFLQEAARRGPVHVRLWSDALVATICGKPPQFPLAERRFFVEAIRYVSSVSVVGTLGSTASPVGGSRPDAVMARPRDDDPQVRAACESRGIDYVVPGPDALAGFPQSHLADSRAGARRVLVTGCYDWLHSGHVEFFKEASELGELYVVVGSDRNVRLLKGDGHPLHSEDERRYMVEAVRYVHRALVSTGSGWMDAEPEVATIRPDIYLVNEDGDVPEKREFCRAHGLDYVVLQRKPHPGLPRRSSTDLRGF